MTLSGSFDLLVELGADPLLFERSGMSLSLVAGTDGAWHAGTSCTLLGEAGRTRRLPLSSLRLAACGTCVPAFLPSGAPGSPQELLVWMVAIERLESQRRSCLDTATPLAFRLSWMAGLESAFAALSTPRFFEDVAERFAARLDAASVRLRVDASSSPVQAALVRRAAASVAARDLVGLLRAEPFVSVLDPFSSPDVEEDALDRPDGEFFGVVLRAFSDTWEVSFSEGDGADARRAAVLAAVAAAAPSPRLFSQVAALPLPAAGTAADLVPLWGLERDRLVGLLLDRLESRAAGLLAGPVEAVASVVESPGRVDVAEMELRAAFPSFSHGDVHVLMAPSSVCEMLSSWGHVRLPADGLSEAELVVAVESFVVLWSEDPDSALHRAEAAWDAARALLPA